MTPTQPFTPERIAELRKWDSGLTLQERTWAHPELLKALTEIERLQSELSTVEHVKGQLHDLNTCIGEDKTDQVEVWGKQLIPEAIRIIRKNRAQLSTARQQGFREGVEASASKLESEASVGESFGSFMGSYNAIGQAATVQGSIYRKAADAIRALPPGDTHAA